MIIDSCTLCTYTIMSTTSIFVTESVNGSFSRVSHISRQYNVTLICTSNFNYRRITKAGTSVFVRDKVDSPYTYIGKIKTILLFIQKDGSYRISFKSMIDRQSNTVCQPYRDISSDNEYAVVACRRMGVVGEMYIHK